MSDKDTTKIKHSIYRGVLFWSNILLYKDSDVSDDSDDANNADDADDADGFDNSEVCKLLKDISL